MNKTMLGIGTVAILAAVLIASSNVGTHDLFAKKYGQSNAQSAAVNNECFATLEDSISQSTINARHIPTLNSNVDCIGDNPQIQDSDGALLTSIPGSTTGSQSSSVNAP